MRAVLDILAPEAPLGRLARAVKLPCCSLVAAVQLELADRSPRRVSLDGYAAVAPEGWWALANIWEGHGPWSSIEAARELLGGTIYGPVLVTTEAPTLPEGVWVVWQRWKGNEGHTQLLRREPDGTVTVVESDDERGLRIHTGGTWSGDAGLSGFTVAYCTLPGVR